MEAQTRRPRLAAKRTARLQRAERKQQLLQQAKSLFVKLGYQHTTTEKIAQAAKVTEPVLYRHFPSKKALFLDVLQDIRQATLQRWREQVQAIGAPLERLHAMVDLYLDSTRAQAVDLRIMHRTLAETDDPDIAASLRCFYLDMENLLVDIVGDGQKAGVFRADLDPRVAAWELIRTAMAFELTLSLRIPVYGEANYVARTIDCLLRGILKPAEPDAVVVERNGKA